MDEDNSREEGMKKRHQHYTTSTPAVNTYSALSSKDFTQRYFFLLLGWVLGLGVDPPALRPKLGRQTSTRSG